MKAKRLIVNADDFGMSRGITDGVLLAHRFGLVTSTSLMANMPAAEYAATAGAKIPSLGIGVHLNICQGQPILPASQIPSLVDVLGHFWRPAILAKKLWRGAVRTREIEAEFRAQIRWVKNCGIVPTHADSHQHMHLYPGALQAFVRALSAEGIPCTRAPRCAVIPNNGVIGGPHEGGPARRILVDCYRRFLQAVVLRRFQMPLARLSFVSRERRDLALLGASWLKTLSHLPPGTFELACHPGLFERGFSETDRIRLQREEELHWLTDSAMFHAVREAGIELITYREIVEQPVSRAAAARTPALGGSA
ncbi:MAG TPA: ChbG/HpnK family deacetylase [Candidatus Acidoferrales bacterium]|nr:ChbG/HpnK family deacetylase [Candidatus Acidoferrales bacterium]